MDCIRIASDWTGYIAADRAPNQKCHKRQHDGRVAGQLEPKWQTSHLLLSHRKPAVFFHKKLVPIYTQTKYTSKCRFFSRENVGKIWLISEKTLGSAESRCRINPYRTSWTKAKATNDAVIRCVTLLHSPRYFSTSFTISLSRHFRATTLSRAFQQRSCRMQQEISLSATECRLATVTTFMLNAAKRHSFGSRSVQKLSSKKSWHVENAMFKNLCSVDMKDLSIHWHYWHSHCVSLHAWGNLTKARTWEHPNPNHPFGKKGHCHHS